MVTALTDRLLVPALTGRLLVPALTDRLLVPALTDQMLVTALTDRLLVTALTDRSLVPALTERLLVIALTDRMLVTALTDRLLVPVLSGRLFERYLATTIPWIGTWRMMIVEAPSHEYRHPAAMTWGHVTDHTIDRRHLCAPPISLLIWRTTAWYTHTHTYTQKETRWCVKERLGDEGTDELSDGEKKRIF